MKKNPFNHPGLSNEEVLNSRRQFGSNLIQADNNNSFLDSIWDAFTEPMFLILVVCASIYFILGQIAEAWFMGFAIILVSAISIYQETINRNALKALTAFTQREVKVIRENMLLKLKNEDLVLGDYVVSSEGELIPADGKIIECNDFSVNESILTGESFSVFKDAFDVQLNKVYSGTFVESGQCVFVCESIGSQTRLAGIGKSIDKIKRQNSPLQKQIQGFVKWMAASGMLVFAIIWLINYQRSGDILNSLLKGLTIAMSILPEEIPVAFSTFMALGAWRLMKKGVIVKNPQTVESLGSATVICTDKTGTITENRMKLNRVYLFEKDSLFDEINFGSEELEEIFKIAMLSSETVPFDSMEKSIHSQYAKHSKSDVLNLFTKVKEYPLSGKPPMMTHIFEDPSGRRIISCKGAVEALVSSSKLNERDRNRILEMADQLSADGLRVLGVGIDESDYTDFPNDQKDFQFRIIGLLGFFDPPKANIAKVFQELKKAGIKLKIITGDNTVTTQAIARMANFEYNEKIVSGEEAVNWDEKTLDDKVKNTEIFTRVFPEAKLKIINSLIRNGEIVSMTGDGVNDGPALKAAHIGIAMGKRGSEIAKQAASLILVDDDLEKVVDAVALGRKIYENLKKAIQYIISIHIPIILTVAIPIIFAWKFPVIFSPIHVIFLELIMGPTCSIVYENEPAEKNSMTKPPRALNTTFFRMKELVLSIIQGLVITLAVLLIYYWTMNEFDSESITRTMVFTTLITANMMLTLVNRSFYYSVLSTLRNKNRLITLVIAISLVLLVTMIYVSPINNFFKLNALNLFQILISFSAAFVSVCWFEVYKWTKRK
ncbi:MAG: cation-translocating P-type ATPase [Saprospiraceae bacterium]|nr:cation-translocating P-type ATPase [Saprospiraceae bacterium]